MTHNIPLSPRPLSHLTAAAQGRVLTTRALREHGVSAAAANERCRPGGPWQLLLPGVFLLHSGMPTSDERLHAALLYAGSESPPIPAQQGLAGRSARPTDLPLPPVVPARPSPAAPGQPLPAQPPEAMITGLAALTLHGFTGAPSLRSLDRIDVLVPRTRRLRSTGCVHIVRGQQLPEPEEVTGLPVAPVSRALADTVAQLTDAGVVRRLLVESVRGGYCEASAVVRELGNVRLLGRPHVREAVEALTSEDRALAEGRLYEMVFRYWLPDPCWNVDLRLPGGPYLGGVDAYWPEQAVALELDTFPHSPSGVGGAPTHSPSGVGGAPTHSPSGAGGATGGAPRSGDDVQWSEYARKREVLEAMGITVVHITPQKLRDSLEQQAAIVRTALMTAVEREPAEYVIVLPR